MAGMATTPSGHAMPPLPDRIRDATFQVVADWVDVNFDVDCFRLARASLCRSMAGLVTLCYLCATSEVPARQASAGIGIALTALQGVCGTGITAYLADFGRRMRSSRARAVIPFARDAYVVAFSLALLAPSTILAFAAVSRCAGALATGHDTVGGPVMVLAWTFAQATFWMMPGGWLLAGCEWKRLHRPGPRPGRLVPGCA